jgi:hypothetical protein
MTTFKFLPNEFEIPLIHKIYEFYKLFHQCLKLFPKTEKYSLGQKIENLILEILELSFKINYSAKNEKMILLKETDAQVHLLKTLIRLAYEVKALDNKKYLKFQEQLQEIGRMIGGWIRYSQI